MIKRSFIFIAVVVFIGFSSSDIYATDFNPSYPRIGIFHFGSAPAAWYAKHDMVMVGSAASLGDDIKSINPATIVLPTKGWTAYGSASTFPIPSGDFDKNAYLVHNSLGAEVYINCCDRLIDQSSYSRPAASGRYKGNSILQALPIQAVENALLGVNDGVATDWLWVKPYGTSDVDFDRNGKNDYSEYGSSWVYGKWQEGTIQLLANLKNELDKFSSKKVSLVNFGFQFQKLGTAHINGMVREWTTSFGNNFASGYFWNDEYKYFMEKAPTPHVALIDGRPSRSDPWINNLVDKTDSRNHLQAMRYLLTGTLLGDAYFNFMTFEQAQNTHNHHIHAWYDEFDVDLGQPKDFGQSGPIGDAQEVESGVWIRFFDKGVSLMNANGNPVTITDQDLRGLPGYDGPYWRFTGGQDMALNGASKAINNGQVFGSITLGGYNYIENNQDKVMGDGAILLKSVKTIVSDIVVDNRGFSTSPGSNEAVFSGGFSQQISGGAEHWSVYSDHNSRSYDGVAYWQPYAVSNVGGNARFVPNIGVAGNYEVFEWHGYLGIDPGVTQEESNVKVTINHAGGMADKNVDQSTNYGKWNSLGTYKFNKGTLGDVTLSAQGANSPVLADAVKFVYRDGGVPITSTPTPEFIRGDLDKDGDVDIFDYNILVDNFGNTNCGNVADIDEDCDVGIFDYNILVENFGK